MSCLKRAFSSQKRQQQICKRVIRIQHRGVSTMRTSENRRYCAAAACRFNTITATLTILPFLLLLIIMSLELLIRVISYDVRNAEKTQHRKRLRHSAAPFFHLCAHTRARARSTSFSRFIKLMKSARTLCVEFVVTREECVLK